MKPLYVIHYTVFPKGNSFKSLYKFFETKEQLDKWLKSKPWIKENCIIFKNIDKGE